MCNRALPKFDEYLQKLELYAKASNIKVLYSNNYVYGGQYSHKFKRITLETELSEAEEIAIFLHELGHSLDLNVLSKSEMKVLEVAENAYNSNKCSTGQLDVVLGAERRAWQYGRAIAKLLGIKLGKWFKEIRKDALNSYKEYA